MPENNKKQYFKELFQKTNQLVVFRNILEDEAIAKVRNLFYLISSNSADEEIGSEYYSLYNLLLEKARKRKLRGHLWRSNFIWTIATAENTFSKICAGVGRKKLDKGLYDAAIHDLEILKNLYHINLQDVNKEQNLPDIFNFNYLQNSWQEYYFTNLVKLENAFAENLPVAEVLQKLCDFYAAVGSGEMGLFTAFRWVEGKGIAGIENPDPVRFTDLIGYENQKKTLIENTEAFVEGKKANNILLYGVRGTGKSSSIKALLNEYAQKGLRLIELPKYQLLHFPEIIQWAREKPQKFIVFIDDLSFESHETEYKYLKAMMEGGIEEKPANILIYATSNRKHLIQEKWSEREEMADEINSSDSLEEKLSLSDRFGITIIYPSPNQEEYLQIVEGLAESHQLNIPRELLREKALKWERWHNVRSGRTAIQFINYLLGK